MNSDKSLTKEKVVKMSAVAHSKTSADLPLHQQLKNTIFDEQERLEQRWVGERCR